MKYCTYFLIDPETQMPFYVGSGNNKTNRKMGRPYEHFCPCNLNKNSRKNNKIKKLLNLGFIKEQIADIFYFSDDRQECLDLEQMYLDLLGVYKNNGLLFNLNLSAEHTRLGITYKHKASTKIKIGLKSKGNTNWLGKKHSEETKGKMSNIHIGNKYTLGHKQTKEHLAKRVEARRITMEYKKALGFLDLGLGI